MAKLNLSVSIDVGSGFCFGVVEAIKKVEKILNTGQTVYCLGQIVHNEEEVKRLEKKGMITITNQQYINIKNVTLLFRAHGEPPSSYQIAKQNNIHLIDASCPIVTRLQMRVKKAFLRGENIYIFDMGFQFVNQDETPGIDFMLPNIKYLEDRKHKIKGVIITHGHLDHIGGIPFLMQKLGNPPLYTRELTSHLIRKRMEEFKSHPKLNINLVAPGDQIKIGELSFEFFNVTHSIPDSMGILVKTPHGQLVFTGDLKLRHENGVPVPYEEKT